MSISEVAYRTWRAASYPLRLPVLRAVRDQVQGRSQHLQGWKGPEPFYFGGALRRPLSPELKRAADDVCRDRQTVLGLGTIKLPADPWHYEPTRDAWWGGRHTENRGLDLRMTWELNRGHDWVLLARAFHATFDERYLATLRRRLRSWRSGNRIAHGVNWLSAMEAAIRIHSLVWTAAFLRGASPDLMPEVAQMVADHAWFVRKNLSRFSSANNHLIVELGALVVAERVLGGRSPRHERYTALLEAECARQTFPDGVNVEMATHYHAFVLESLLLVAYLERAHGCSATTIEETIGRMASFLDALVLSDGRLLEQGDSDDGNLLVLFKHDHARQLLAAARGLEASATGSPGDPALPGEAVFWLTGGRNPERPQRRRSSRVFTSSGQIVLCSPRLRAVLDAGPFGFGALAAHAHCDMLALNVAIDSRRLLIDRGTFRYNGDALARDQFRNTAAHNTLQLGNREQAQSLGPFLWGRRPTARVRRSDLGDEVDIVQVEHDGFRPVTHKRSVIRVRDALLIIDELDDTSCVRTVRWHFAPEIEILPPCEHRIDAKLTGCTAAELQIFGADLMRVVRVPHSDAYGNLTQASTVELSGSRSIATIIKPSDTDVDVVAELVATARAAVSDPILDDMLVRSEHRA